MRADRYTRRSKKATLRVRGLSQKARDEIRGCETHPRRQVTLPALAWTAGPLPSDAELVTRMRARERVR